MGNRDDKVALAAIQPDDVAVDGVTEDDVIAFLEQHPRLFSEHPQLLEGIELAHTTGSASSLIERQVTLLRQRNEQLRERLHQLAELARHNERRMRNANRLAVSLLGAGDLTQVVQMTRDQLTRAFAVDAVFIGLYGEQDAADLTTIGEAHPLRQQYANLMRTGLIECGPLAEPARGSLFGDQPIASAAVVPLDRVQPLGLLAVGSEDAHRFQPAMGTLFLDLIADLLTAAIRRHLPDEHAAG
ncbi:MAG: DUF484 family protein [Abyssibacter sp.]|jgi:uncharacterized protein|uniref:DUF484 family protein n=1 Tax=Abyssibacter sp. TaxID=2320200 RepID=UPI00321A9B87